MPEESDRFYKLMYLTPLEIYKFTCLRLIPKVKEFEEAQGENGFHLIDQVRRWLTRFDQMFYQEQFDTKIYDWKKMSRGNCDQEVEQRTTLIKWTRAIDKDFDYESHKKAMDHFNFDDNVVITESDIIREMAQEEKYEKEREKEGEADWDTFHKHHKVLMRNFNYYNDELVKSYILKTKHNKMSDLWKEEVIYFWEDGDFDLKKRIFEFHGRVFCRNLQDYQEFLEEYDLEKDKIKKKREDKKKNKQKKDVPTKSITETSESQQGEPERGTQSLGGMCC